MIISAKSLKNPQYLSTIISKIFSWNELESTIQHLERVDEESNEDGEERLDFEEIQEDKKEN